MVKMLSIAVNARYTQKPLIIKPSRYLLSSTNFIGVKMNAASINGIIVIHPIPIGINNADRDTKILNTHPITNINIVAIISVFVSRICMYSLKNVLPIHNTANVTKKLNIFLTVIPSFQKLILFILLYLTSFYIFFLVLLILIIKD